MTWRLGVDIGGTFTDFALFDERGYEIAVLKRLTTPADPSIAVIEGTAALLRREDVPMAVDPGLIPVFDTTGRASLGHALETAVHVEPRIAVGDPGALTARWIESGYVEAVTEAR